MIFLTFCFYQSSHGLLQWHLLAQSPLDHSRPHPSSSSAYSATTYSGFLAQTWWWRWPPRWRHPSSSSTRHHHRQRVPNREATLLVFWGWGMWSFRVCLWGSWPRLMRCWSHKNSRILEQLRLRMRLVSSGMLISLFVNCTVFLTCLEESFNFR